MNSQLFQYIATKKEYAKEAEPFLLNYGNWKLAKKTNGTKVWKCTDCNTKLTVEELETETVTETPVADT